MNQNPEEIALRIIENFKKLYLNKDGLISATFPPSSDLLFNHLDDIAPFFLFFNNSEFMVNQVLTLKKKYTFNQILARKNLIYSYLIDEFLGGIYCIWEKTQNEEIKIYLDYVFDKIQKYFIHKNNLFGVFNIYTRNLSKEYYFWSAGLLETFLEMKDYYKCQEKVEDIANHWISNKFFLKNHLFPFRWRENLVINFLNLISSHLGRYHRDQPVGDWSSSLSFLKNKFKEIRFKYFTSGSYVQFFKSNTTFVFTLIELFRITSKTVYKNTVINWINSVFNKIVKNGIVYGLYYPNGRYKATNLANTFILIDVLMDAYYFLKNDKRYLELAKKIIDTRVANQWKNGLIPDEINGSYTFLDTLVDFSISIRRYAELAQDYSYLEYSQNLMETTLKYHEGENGFYTYINKDGYPDKNKVIHPKYNALLLKGIINITTTNQKIYDKSNSYELHDLFKDR